jgi:hypothetical protein
MASFLSTLFSGGAEKEAADKNRALLAQYGTSGNAALDTGLNQSTGAVNTGAAQAGSYLDKNTGLYSGLKGAGTGYLDSGLQSGLGALGQAGEAYAPLSALAGKYGAGTDLYMNSLGVNGAAGNQAAVDAFQAGPGYEFTKNQGLDAINRRRAASGMLGSGNADIDAITYGTGLANQTYGDWQKNLAGLINPELQATSGAATGQAGVYKDMAALYGADTAARLGLEQAVTTGQAGVNSAQAANQLALGNSLAGLYSGDATNRVGLQGNIASGGMSANNTQAAGEAAGAKNLLGFGQAVASAAMGMPGLGGGGGGGSAPATGGNTGFNWGATPIGSAYKSLSSLFGGGTA